MGNALRISVPTPVHMAADDSDTSRRFTTCDVAAYVPTSGPGYLVATNGRMAAYVPVPVEGDRSQAVALLPADAVRTCKVRKNRPTPALTVNGAVSTDDGTAYPADHTRHYPPTADVLPTAERLRDSVQVSLNPTLLLALARAIGAGDGVTLSIPVGAFRKICPIVVQAATASAPVPDAVGLLMPIAHGKGTESAADTAVARCTAARAAIQAAEARKAATA